jgi:hypothetical protein
MLCSGCMEEKRGKVSSPAKTAAVRENGKLAGRPKKVRPRDEGAPR